jgi:hypothetical protein
VHYAVDAGERATLKLAKTKAGKKALRSAKVRKAVLRIGGATFTVRLRR